MDKYITTRDKKYLRRGFLYFGIILAFVVGAVIESWLLPPLGSFAILLSPVLLMAALVIMFYNVTPDDGDTYIEG